MRTDIFLAGVSTLALNLILAKAAGAADLPPVPIFAPETAHRGTDPNGYAPDRGTNPKEVSRQGKTHNNSQLVAGGKVPMERNGYKFSNMMHGGYCKIAYTQILKANVSGPVAMALGEESCGLGGASNETVTDAEAEALEKCRSATIGCQIIFSKGAG